ncbi:MAG: sialidase family protein [Christensenellales bacterium]|jgi:sialidase-1
MSVKVHAVHGIVCRVEHGPENYFGWPSAAKLGDGTIVAGCSGLRRAHVCPWGKSVVCYSRDGGETYTPPEVVHDDMIDNRDLGVIALGGQKYAITWFSIDIRKWDMHRALSGDNVREALEYMETWDDFTVQTLMGSWMKITNDGGKTWTRPIRTPVSSPHGFIRPKGGALGYLGKRFDEDLDRPFGSIQYSVSRDEGYTWSIRGTVGLPEGEDLDRYHEPHVIELNDGALMGAIRYHVPGDAGGGLDTCLTFSRDGGSTWTTPERMHVGGSPPHLLRHSSGVIVLTYGYREVPYGQRARISRDEGRTWSDELILRDDGETGDLGYPCTVEMDDGSLYTVYYQALTGHSNTSILWSRWELPKR